MSRAVLIADLHVHWHRDYDPACLRRDVLPRLRRHSGGAADIVLCWTEATRCREFDRLAAGQGPWPVVRAASGGAVMRIEDTAGDDGVWIVRGQQIVTAERIEILAIGVRNETLEGRPADEVIQMLHQIGAPALIPWAPGKWWGRRGRLIAALFERWPPDVLMPADSSLRPRGWPLPRHLRRWSARWGRRLAGSDPLAFPGEERHIGRYATKFESSLDASDPLASLTAMLRDRDVAAQPVGSRSGPWAVAWRIARHMWATRLERHRVAH